MALGIRGAGLLPVWRPSAARPSAAYVRLDARGTTELAGRTPFEPGGSRYPTILDTVAPGAGTAPAAPATQRKRGRPPSPAPAAKRPRLPTAAVAAKRSRPPVAEDREAPQRLTPEEKRRRRVARRAARRVASRAASVPTAAEAQSVGDKTRLVYETAYGDFRRWAQKCGHRDVSTMLPDNLDLLLVDFIDKVLYQTGQDASAVKNVLFGTIYSRSLPRGAGTLPRCRRALAGFLKDEPPVSEDPCPIEAAALLVDWLMRRVGLEPKLAGLAFLCSYDLLTRPSETLALKPLDVVAPGVAKYQQTSVIVAPSGPPGSMGGRQPAKSGEFDDTVIAGLKGMRLEFVPMVLRHLKSIAHAGQTLFSPLTLHRYEYWVQRAVKECQLQPLRITPHSARHGGASTSSYLGLLTIKQIQRRGRWLAPKSVRRYEKTGKLTRQVAAMNKQAVRRGDALLNGPLKEAVLLQMKSIAKLRREERS